MTTRTCTKCGKTKPVSEFYKKRVRSDGVQIFQGTCKECYLADSKIQYEKNKPVVLERQAKRRKDKAVEIAEYMQSYYEKNRDDIIAKTRDYQTRPERKLADKERHKKRYQDHYDEVREKQRLRNATPEGRQKQKEIYERHYAKNKLRFIVRGAERRASRIRATPAWYKHNDSVPFFEEAKRLSEKTGILHVVDHIVPLRGKTVCGLHVRENFQVITAMENWSKFNHFTDDDLEEEFNSGAPNGDA